MANKLTRKKRNSKNNKDTKIMYVKHKKSKHRRIKVTKKKRNKKSKKKAKGPRIVRELTPEEKIAFFKAVASVISEKSISKSTSKSKSKSKPTLTLTEIKQLLAAYSLNINRFRELGSEALNDIIRNKELPGIEVIIQEATSEGKLMGRLATLQTDAIIDYLNKHLEKPDIQPKFETQHEIMKKSIWMYDKLTSALSKEKIGKGKGVGDHIYGIRETVCTKGIIGSNSRWNLIQCPHADNVAWKKVIITLTGKEINDFKFYVNGKDLKSELHLTELKPDPLLNESDKIYSGSIDNMIAEFNDIFLKLIKIKLNLIHQLNNDNIPELLGNYIPEQKNAETGSIKPANITGQKKDISEYMQGMIKKTDVTDNLYTAHEKFMKFYEWKKYCAEQGAKMFWTNEDGAGKKLNDALTKIIEGPLRAMVLSVRELTPEQVKQNDESLPCSLPEEIDDESNMSVDLSKRDYEQNYGG